MGNEIINRVEQNNNIVQVSLDEYYPKGNRVLFDIKGFLKQEIILVEKEFRTSLIEFDWSIYKDQYVGIICSVDAIVPLWAFMLVAVHIKPFAKMVVFGNKEELEKSIFKEVLTNIDYTKFKDVTVIVKGCGQYPIPESAVVDFSVKLQDHAKKILFGEACSAVPLYKKKKN